MAIETQEKIYDRELQKRVKDLLASGKVDATTVARGIGKSPATLSLYLKGNYDGKVDLLENDLKKYLSFFEKKEQIEEKSLKFTQTSISDKIFKAASMCQIYGKMGVCWGSPGIGKSTAVIEYQKNNTGVIVVDPIEKTSTRAVLEQIANQLKVFYEHNTTVGDFIENISKKLEKNKYIIIIDEAENLKVDIFKIIRKIFDKNKEYCGVLFVGTYELFELLKRVRNGFPYITNRIGYAAKLDDLNFEDVSKLVKQYYPNIDKTLIDYIAKSCKYNARNTQNILDLCYSFTSQGKDELNNTIIESAKESLFI